MSVHQDKAYWLLFGFQKVCFEKVSLLVSVCVCVCVCVCVGACVHCSAQVSTVQDGLKALGKAHDRFFVRQSFRCVAFESVPLLT